MQLDNTKLQFSCYNATKGRPFFTRQRQPFQNEPQRTQNPNTCDPHSHRQHRQRTSSASEPVEGATLALERVDDVHGGDSLAAGVLGVGDGITDDVLEKDLEDAAGLLIDETGDSLHATTAGETTDRRLGDPLDVVAEHLAVALRAAFAEPLASLTATGHGADRYKKRKVEL
ncbi:hypothetical protein MUK42_14190 [Musa troglodytarum]|uniref:Uncharacterized protein n=1 Tax=Musa troglodytarum TaxID=320322 RepID=A0A9E7ICK1_9LILI|nr:hypothetical protein MUK42_14190 [Musa troglodytarum]